MRTTGNIVAIRCFLLPKPHNSTHNHRLVQIPYVIFERLRTGIFSDFCPQKKIHKKVLSIFPVVFYFQTERWIDNFSHRK